MNKTQTEMAINGQRCDINHLTTRIAKIEQELQALLQFLKVRAVHEESRRTGVSSVPYFKETFIIEDKVIKRD